MLERNQENFARKILAKKTEVESLTAGEMTVFMDFVSKGFAERSGSIAAFTNEGLRFIAAERRDAFERIRRGELQ